MKRFTIPAISFLLLSSCSQSFKPAEDAQDAGREFIRASLDGNYEKASFYLYPDSTNNMLFDKWKKDHERLDHEEQKIPRRRHPPRRYQNRQRLHHLLYLRQLLQKGHHHHPYRPHRRQMAGRPQGNTQR
ncbi:hypothetical protein ACQ86N_24440 [Puia sp. P3]|uniref:hypothetical protein n=1 Tax=Puia sp. P3 TaxID=3423952 RepID=UPI003D66F548